MLAMNNKLSINLQHRRVVHIVHQAQQHHRIVHIVHIVHQAQQHHRVVHQDKRWYVISSYTNLILALYYSGMACPLRQS